MTKRRIIIPARYHSSRLPGKVLADLNGKPMLQRVYERACQCQFDSVVIATDYDQVAQIAHKMGADVCMTDVNHPTGTDRAAEVMAQKGYGDQDIIIALQADEPLIPIANIQQVADLLVEHTESSVATLCEPITDLADMINPNWVKVVCDRQGHALFFSRAPIPWHRNAFPDRLPQNFKGFVHIGIYGYRGAFLQQYPKLDKSDIEQWEALEQLRILWHGYKIQVAAAQVPTPPGVNTQQELDHVRQLIQADPYV